MKKLIIFMLGIITIFLPLEAKVKRAHKVKPQIKQFILDEDIHLFNHGIYIIKPGKLYRLKSLWHTRDKGYYTYRKYMKKIPLVNSAPIFDAYNFIELPRVRISKRKDADGLDSGK